MYAESAAQCPEVKPQHFYTAQRNREDVEVIRGVQGHQGHYCGTLLVL